jgi:acetyl esterase/lipase
MNIRLFLLLLLTMLAAPITAAEPIIIDVWPDKVPGEKGDIGPEQLQPPRGRGKPIQRLTNVTRPTITVYRPKKDQDTGAAVLICPGGGYHILAWDLEGTEVAEWLNTIGVTGIVLKYRVPRRQGREKHDGPLQDAQRAMSLVRKHADEWGIDANRIGILGFSAGGHLSAATSTNFDKRSYQAVDAIDRISCRPDFAVLVYPAYLIDGDELSAEIRVTADTPQTFFVHASDDGISSENSIAMYLALKKAKVRTEIHIYASGGHGFGLRPTEHPASTWPKRCEQWLRSRGILEANKGE